MAHALELACGHRPLTCPGSSRTADPTLPKPDLAGTVRAVVSGDQAAFARLYADYVRMIHAILLGRVPHRDVDDLVQEHCEIEDREALHDRERNPHQRIRRSHETPGRRREDGKLLVILSDQYWNYISSQHLAGVRERNNRISVDS